MNDLLRELQSTLSQVLYGQERVIHSLMVALLARGHVILEGVPGIGKTLAARGLSRGLGLTHRRIQFTPDLMPSDVVGATIYRPALGQFEFVKGPVFTDLLIADEINRTPPKTQAALLEAMEERQVTVDGVSHPLPPQFFVVATQNPLELQGTYPLPEAQLDRFSMRIEVGYPSEAAEIQMLANHRSGGTLTVSALIDAPQLSALQRQSDLVKCDQSLFQYMASLSRATRVHDSVRIGASPRASGALLAASRAQALLSGRDYATPDDIKAVAVEVLAHRLALKAEAELDGMTGKSLIESLLQRTPAV
jgi:MoxR-like ATPase